MTLSLEQKMHNNKVDQEIRQNDLEHELYIKECDALREQFKIEHPNHPYADYMFLPVKAKKQVCAIYYDSEPDEPEYDIADDKGGKKEWITDLIVFLLFVVGVVVALVFVFG